MNITNNFVSKYKTYFGILLLTMVVIVSIAPTITAQVTTNKKSVKIDSCVVVMTINSPSISYLYEGCGNLLEVQAPALGTNFNPSFSANGAACLPGGKKGAVIIVPSLGAKSVTLNVSNNNIAIGSQTFSVRSVPYALIVASGDDGVDFDEKVVRCPNNLTVRVVADRDFATFFPKEASYRVVSFDITMSRGAFPISQQQVVGSTVNTEAFKTRAKEGDRLVITNIVVQRANFIGEILNARVSTKYIVVALK